MGKRRDRLPKASRSTYGPDSRPFREGESITTSIAEAAVASSNAMTEITRSMRDMQTAINQIYVAPANTDPLAGGWRELGYINEDQAMKIGGGNTMTNTATVRASNINVNPANPASMMDPYKQFMVDQYVQLHALLQAERYRQNNAPTCDGCKERDKKIAEEEEANRKATGVLKSIAEAMGFEFEEGMPATKVSDMVLQHIEEHDALQKIADDLDTECDNLAAAYEKEREDAIYYRRMAEGIING